MPKLLLNFAELTKIPFSTKPLPQGGSIEYLTPQDFKRQFNACYSENIYTDKLLFIKLRKFKNCLTNINFNKLIAEIDALQHKPKDNLVICYIDPAVGCGLFTKEAIAKDTLVGIYPGTIMPRRKIFLQHDCAFAYTRSKLSFNPEKIRGIASFVQHLPEERRCSNENLQRIIDAWEPRNVYLPTGETTSIRGTDLVQEEELFTTQFNEDILPRLATANVVAQFLVYKKVPLIVFTATRDIKAGGQIGYSYRHHYWNARGLLPEYFDLQGNIIPHIKYCRIFGKLSFANFNFTGNYLKLITRIKNNDVIDLLGDDGKVHRIATKFVTSELIRVGAI